MQLSPQGLDLAGSQRLQQARAGGEVGAMGRRVGAIVGTLAFGDGVAVAMAVMVMVGVGEMMIWAVGLRVTTGLGVAVRIGGRVAVGVGDGLRVAVGIVVQVGLGVLAGVANESRVGDSGTLHAESAKTNIMIMMAVNL